MSVAKRAASTVQRTERAAGMPAAFSFAVATLLFPCLTQAQAPVVDKSGDRPATEVPTKLAPPPAAPLATNAPAAPATALKSFVSIGDKPAVLFDAPSARANKTFIILRGTPLEALVKLDKWTKVRDAEGTIGWIENASLGDRRQVQVSAASAEVRAAPSSSAALVFEAQRQVLLEVTGAASPDGWIPVRHRDGQTGFVRTAQVWGE